MLAPRSLRRVRRLVQFLSLSLLVVIIAQTRYPLDGFVNPLVYFHLDPFVMFVTSLAERVLVAGVALAFVTFMASFVLGRAFCGWFCPLGALIDFAGRLPSLFRLRREGEPSKGRRAKYYLAGAVALCAVFGVQFAWVFDPFSIFVRSFSFTLLPNLFKAVDSSCVFLLQSSDSFGFLEPLYYRLQDLLAGARPVFAHSTAVFLFFLAILAAVLVRRRFWCRYICPLGATLAVGARFSLLKRAVTSCCPGCTICKDRCRMNAIRRDNTHLSSECVLCLDCAASCPGRQGFSFARAKKEARDDENRKGITRSQFLVFLAGAFAPLLVGRHAIAAMPASPARPVIRPPGALPEDEFTRRCIRCGNCMKVCPTNVLQPALFEGGWYGVWTPKADTVVGYCEYQCNLCSRVCPTGAIRSVSVGEKMRLKIGRAVVDRAVCLPWAKGEECIVCEEHCPIATKAIKLTPVPGGRTLQAPIIDESLCVGCALCVAKCPARPKKAINVRPL